MVQELDVINKLILTCAFFIGMLVGAVICIIIQAYKDRGALNE
jgi:hypothetical protein